MPPRRWTWDWRHPALWTFLFAVVLYLPSLRYDFVSDDYYLIQNDVLFDAPKFSAGWLARDFWAATGARLGMWRPLITISFWIDARIGHGLPGWFHAMNILGHAAASALVAILAASGGAGWVASLIAGLLFAGLPANLEAVVPISGRTDVYSTAFLLAAMWRDRLARARGATRPPWSGMLLLALSLASKEIGILFLPLLLVAEWVEQGPKFDGRRAASWIAPYAFITAFYGVVHAGLVGFPGGLPARNAALALRNRLSEIAAFGAYLRALLPGAAHTPYGAIRAHASALEPAVWGSAILFVALIVGTVLLLRRRDRMAIPLSLFWIAMLPVLLPSLLQGLVFFAERFLYLPAAGLPWALGIALGRIMPAPVVAQAGGRSANWTRIAVPALGGALVLVQGMETMRGQPMWANDVAIARAKVSHQPWSTDAHGFWASQLVALGNDDEAAREATEALRLDPTNSLAHVVMGDVYLDANQPDSALAHAQIALDMNHTLVEARYVAGESLIRLGRPGEALPLLQRLGRRGMTDPVYAAAWGTALMSQDQAEAALPLLRRAVADSVVGRNPLLHYEIGLGYAQQQRFVAAKGAFQNALALDPGYYEAWIKLAGACAMTGDPAGRDLALARAAALPQAQPAVIAELRKQLSAMSAKPR